MGLGGHAIDAIGREHAFRPIAGDVVFVGRQTVHASPRDLALRLAEHGHAVDAAAIELDRTTRNRAGMVSDRSVFRALGLAADRIQALDVSPYEGAELIHDLNRPIPPALRESADFIVDGSTLDNVFDPATALRNLAAMLRPGGRLLMVNAWSPRDGAYTLASAPWWLDYFVVNRFADVRVYAIVSAGRSSNVYWLDPAFMASREAYERTPVLACWWRRPCILVLAEKAAHSTVDAVPAQAHYRSAAEWQNYRAAIAPLLASARPHPVRSTGWLFPRSRSPRSRGFVWIDGAYRARLLAPWISAAAARGLGAALRTAGGGTRASPSS